MSTFLFCISKIRLWLSAVIAKFPRNRGMSLGKFGRIAVGWSVITFAGVYGFVLSKNSVDKRRYESMQVRERMRKANIGDYQAVGDRRFSG